IPGGAQHRTHGSRGALFRVDRPCDPRGIGARGDGVSKNVGIVIVSHSPDVAKGAADMVRQMVGMHVPLAWCGGNPAGGLGTSVEAIVKALELAWSDSGVVIMVDMG